MPISKSDCPAEPVEVLSFGLRHAETSIRFFDWLLKKLHLLVFIYL